MPYPSGDGWRARAERARQSLEENLYGRRGIQTDAGTFGRQSGLRRKPQTINPAGEIVADYWEDRRPIDVRPEMRAFDENRKRDLARLDKDIARRALDSAEARSKSLGQAAARAQRALKTLARSSPALAWEILTTPGESPNLGSMPGWKLHRRNCVTGCGGVVMDQFAGLAGTPTNGNRCVACVSFLNAQATWSSSWLTASTGNNWVGWIPQKTVTTGECSESWQRIKVGTLPFRDPFPGINTWPSPYPMRSPLPVAGARESGEPRIRGRTRARSWPRTAVRTVIEPPKPPTQVLTEYREAPTPPEIGEMKFIMAPHPGSWFAWIMVGLTEGLEFIDAAHSNLPREYQWKREGGLIFDLGQVIRHRDKVDWQKTARDLLANQIDDAIFGRAGRVQAETNRRLNRKRGPSNEAFRGGDGIPGESSPSPGELLADEIFRQLNGLERI